MNQKKQVGKNIIALSFLFFLLLPTSFQFSLIFEKHEHIVCKEKLVHVHKSILECDMCMFYFTSSNYILDQFNELKLLIIPDTTNDSFTSLLFFYSTISNIQLRGPPILS
tara:strand:- start:8507 stop:8836 length:330 start_codon:yes stop_codon:yes gene_type:complete